MKKLIKLIVLAALLAPICGYAQWTTYDFVSNPNAAFPLSCGAVVDGSNPNSNWKFQNLWAGFTLSANSSQNTGDTGTTKSRAELVFPLYIYGSGGNHF